jgi:23S rRNA (adenine2503-C2)-methyltransferase
MKDIFNYTLEELRAILVESGLPSFAAAQVFSWVYQKGVHDFEKMTNVSKKAQGFLKEKFYFSKLKLLKNEVSRDGTTKFLFGLEDKFAIESVFIPEETRGTFCVSSQVGCKYSCKFCMSGQKGFKRNLTVAEIVGQFLRVAELVAPLKITNIVFMGIGEPLDNFNNVVKAIKILMEPLGIGLGRRKVSISTCGLAPELKKIYDLKLGIKLSVSLHSADNEIRSKIMPVNKKYPLPELFKVIKTFDRDDRYPVIFEYVLIKGVNSSKADAIKLARFLSGVSCKVNLIPYNDSSLNEKAPDDRIIEEFIEVLKKKRVFYTLRKSRGEDISAACGQLRALWGEKTDA